ncbi:hypothetical protein C8J57DRAFT_1493913 [Mycena rebaudengoi]|nr:hypothetical protein C8J57DRAFT_1493913 [Mycena rebaudengoi]
MKASGLESWASVPAHTFQLVAMLFVAVAAAVPTDMLKREPGSSLESEARGKVHCNAICAPVHCGHRPVTARDCFGNPCACGHY